LPSDVGVGHLTATSLSGRAFLSCRLLLPDRKSLDVAVGHFRIASVSVVPVCRSGVHVAVRLPDECASFAVEVGQVEREKEEALSLVWRANVLSAEQDCRNQETQVLKVSCDDVKTLR